MADANTHLSLDAFNELSICQLTKLIQIMFYKYIQDPNGVEIIKKFILKKVNFNKILVIGPRNIFGGIYRTPKMSPLKCLSLMEPSKIRNDISVLLLESGHLPDFAGVTDKGFTPLFCAFSRGNHELCKILINYNANCYSFSYGRSILHFAILSQDYQTIQIALDKRLSNKKNDKMQTALHIHATFEFSKNWLKIFKSLINYMISDSELTSSTDEVMAEDEHKMTAIDYIWLNYLKKKSSANISLKSIKQGCQMALFNFKDAEKYPILEKTFIIIRKYQFGLYETPKISLKNVESSSSLITQNSYKKRALSQDLHANNILESEQLGICKKIKNNQEY